ncbi:hypothetical protein V6N13_114360 [Hibiscus sabdariffa]
MMNVQDVGDDSLVCEFSARADSSARELPIFGDRSPCYADTSSVAHGSTGLVTNSYDRLAFMKLSLLLTMVW